MHSHDKKKVKQKMFTHFLHQKNRKMLISNVNLSWVVLDCSINANRPLVGSVPAENLRVKCSCTFS